MTKKLEEIFDLDSSDDQRSMTDKLDKEQEHKDDNEANNLLKTKFDLDKIDAALPQVDGLAEDSEIDQYAQEAFQAYKDLMQL